MRKMDEIQKYSTRKNLTMKNFVIFVAIFEDEKTMYIPIQKKSEGI